MNNKERVIKVQSVAGLNGEESLNKYYRVADLICDLKHYCDQFKIDFNKEIEMAEIYYKTENEVDND